MPLTFLHGRCVPIVITVSIQVVSQDYLPLFELK